MLCNLEFTKSELIFSLALIFINLSTWMQAKDDFHISTNELKNLFSSLN